jgi:hypothetical protein
MAGTAHDFTVHNGAVVDPDTGELEGNVVDIGLCTFCHTPHRALSTRLLWNHTLSSQTFSWDDVETTIGGTDLPEIATDWMGVSKNCLSCHDGTVAIGDVAWFAAESRTGANAILDHQHDDPDDPAKIAGAGGSMNGNHPVAHPYPFNQAPSTYNSVTTGDSVISEEFVADPTTNNIRLFRETVGGDVVAGTEAGATGIECSSCHDPHNGSTVEDEFFLRGTLTGNDASYICLKCHAK